jgi:DNA replication and repair protein RecF
VAAGTVRLGCTVTSTTRGTRKMYAVNGRSVRYASFLGSLRVVTFAPADMHLVGGSPAGRRSFLNVALSQDRRAYYHDLARYQKALAQKSALLRSPEIDGDLLAIYDETLVQAGTGLILARAHYAAALQQAAARAHAAWSGNEQLGAEYQPNVPFEVAAADAVAGAFGARLRASAAQERARQMPLVGPHRDDLRMTLDGRPLAVYGSQGQQRTAVLALKVAEYTVLHERSGEAPLLLLDDVLSELDPERARAFLEGVGAFEQAFVTVTHLPSTMPRGAVYSVENAALTRRDAGTVR